MSENIIKTYISELSNNLSKLSILLSKLYQNTITNDVIFELFRIHFPIKDNAVNVYYYLFESKINEKHLLIKIQTVSQLASGLGLVFSNIREGKLEITPDLINLVSKIEKDLRELLFCIKESTHTCNVILTYQDIIKFIEANN
jgi:hypothetical protein